jgi:hypothetical protein
MTFRFHPLKALCAAFFAAAALAPVAIAEEVTLEQHIKPLLADYCFDCHNAQNQKGDLDLQIYADNPKLYENREIWEKVIELVESGEMPPKKKPQPMPDEREKLIHFIDGQLAKFDCNLEPNPGRVTIRRLNRAEYTNTIRDLLKVDFQPRTSPMTKSGTALITSATSSPASHAHGEVSRRGRGCGEEGDSGDLTPKPRN